jgi:hypothetical protein
MDPTQIDPMHDCGIGGVEGSHGLKITGQHQTSLPISLPFLEVVDRLDHRHEAHFDIGRYRHSVELLLPIALGDLIVHQDDQIDPHRPSPSNYHLTMDEAVIDPAEHDGHQGIRMDFSPAATTRAAASAALRFR